MLDQRCRVPGLLAAWLKKRIFSSSRLNGSVCVAMALQAVDAFADRLAHGVGEHGLHPGGAHQLGEELVVGVVV